MKEEEEEEEKKKKNINTLADDLISSTQKTCAKAIKLTARSRVVLEKLTVTHLIKRFPAEGLQDPVSESYRQSLKCSPHLRNLFH
jgi:hypothetical protein